MAKCNMSLMDMVSQNADEDFLGQLAETTLAMLMEFEVAQLIGTSAMAST